MASNDKNISNAMALLEQLRASSDDISPEQLQEQIQKITEQVRSATLISQGENRLPISTPDVTIPQSQPLQGMVQNRAGGFSYAVDDLTSLKRFIVMGSQERTYNTRFQPASVDVVVAAVNLIRAGRGQEVLDTITDFAVNARVAREENILLVLRECALFEGEAMYDENTTIQRAAYNCIVKICNIPTKLFRFIELCEARMKQSWKPIEIPPSKTQLRKRALAKKKSEAEKQPVETCDEIVEAIPSEASSTKKKSKKKKKKKPAPKPKISKFKKSTGWGRKRKRGIGSFYTDPNKSAARLLLLLTKYKMRHNWSHLQVLSYVHPKMTGELAFAKNVVLKYCTRGFDKCMEYVSKNCNSNCMDCETNQIVQYIKVLEQTKNLSPDKSEDVKTLLKLLEEYGIRGEPLEYSTVEFGKKETKENKEEKKSAFQLTREHLPTRFQKLPEVWEALLKDMPMTALIRNLGRMTSMGLFTKEGNLELVEKALQNGQRLHRARIHPIKILIATEIYGQGHGDQGFQNTQGNPLTWQAQPRIMQALDKAFYLSFKQGDASEKNPYNTGLKFMLCLDVSGSMTWSGCHGCEQITPAVASFAMAMVTWNIEENCRIYAFGSRLENLDNKMSRDMSINAAMDVGKSVQFGRTDCSLPMQHATHHALDVDVFIVYTDSDTWFGKIHPSEALITYRRVMKKPEAKMVVVAMQRNEVSIASPDDKYMMDICGFDADVPEILHEFVRGKLS